MKRKKHKQRPNGQQSQPSQNIDIKVGSTVDGQIAMMFDRPIDKLLCSPSEAREVAVLLFRHAAEIEVRAQLGAANEVSALVQAEVAKQLAKR